MELDVDVEAFVANRNPYPVISIVREPVVASEHPYESAGGIVIRDEGVKRSKNDKRPADR